MPLFIGNYFTKTIFIYLLWIFCFFSIDSYSQAVVLEEDLTAKPDNELFGPNKKHFVHFYLGYGLVAGAGQSDQLKITYGSSREWLMGIRYKNRINNYYAWGVDVSYGSKSYEIEQNIVISFPLKDTVRHTEEYLYQRTLYVELYNRFNYGRRGDYMGRFIDIGIYGGSSIYPTYETIDEYNNKNAAGSTKTTQIHSGLSYISPYTYGLSLRIGFNWLTFYANYRLANVFSNTYTARELPRIVVGLQIGIHRSN